MHNKNNIPCEGSGASIMVTVAGVPYPAVLVTSNLVIAGLGVSFFPGLSRDDTSVEPTLHWCHGYLFLQWRMMLSECFSDKAWE